VKVYVKVYFGSYLNQGMLYNHNVLRKVYKARLRRNGQMVAVKVQRPGVKAAIALDILILRFVAGIIRRAGKFNTDLQVLLQFGYLQRSYVHIGLCNLRVYIY